MNLGKVSDKEAKSTTIWMEQAVPFDDNLLGELLIELKGEVELPYTDEEINLIAGVFPETEETEEESELNFDEEFARYSITVYKDDKDEIKEIHQTILDKHVNIPNNIDAAVVSWAILKLATMDESQELLKQLIDTKVKLTQKAEESDESND